MIALPKINDRFNVPLYWCLSLSCTINFTRTLPSAVTHPTFSPDPSLSVNITHQLVLCRTTAKMENSFEAKMERLHQEDQNFINGYKRFEGAIRQYRQSIFSGSLEDHLLCVKRKPISEISERQQISSVLSYHDWVCKSKQLLAGSTYLTLPQVLVSYDDVFHYSKMRVEELGQRTWSQSKLCRAINRMLQFIRGVRTCH